MNKSLPNHPERLALPGASDNDYVFVSDSEETVHLRDYWKTVVKRRRLLMAIFLFFLIAGAYFNFTATKLYRSSSTLKIEPQNPNVTNVAESGNLSAGGSIYDYHQTQFKLLESRMLATRVIGDLKLESNRTFTSARVTSANPFMRIQAWFLGTLNTVIAPLEEFFRDKTTTEEFSVPAKTPPVAPDNSGKPVVVDRMTMIRSRFAPRYLSFLDVKPVKGTRLVEVVFETPDGRLSQQLADAHVKGFIRMSLESRFDLTKEAREFLDAKNAELKTKLEQSEAELNSFRQRYGVVSMEKGENIVVDRMVQLNQALTTARAQRIDAESLYRTVESQSTQNLAQVMREGLVPALRSSLTNLEAEKVKLSTIFKADHPRMIEINQQISETQRRLKIEIANVIRGIRDNFYAARAKEQALQAEAQKQQQLALNLKEVGVQYAVLEEEVKVNRTLYESVLKRLNETNISNDLAISNMQIMQFAERSRYPSYPSTPLNIALFAFVGLFIGTGLVFFLEYLDSSVNTPEHVWRAVNLSTLGVVPDVNSLSGRLTNYRRLTAAKFLPRKAAAPRLIQHPEKGKELIVAHHPLSILSEAYRTIRTALLFSRPEAPPKVIVVTSPSPSEGKTATTLNLAVALAQDGFKVLVVDADLRRGCCHTRLHMRNNAGLTNILTGHEALDNCILSTSVSGFFLLPRGICPPNPTELLGSHKMKEVLKDLREKFDFILVDTPPAIAVSDSPVLSTLSDGVILVFHASSTSAASARQVKERLDALRTPILGVVLNGIDIDNPEYSYYRSYYGSDYVTNIDPPGNGYVGNGRRGAGPGKADETSPFEQPARSSASPAPQETSTVPQTFFNRVVIKLSEAVGPMAPIIVDDHIALLGEVRDSFPKNRLKELFERISEEILDNKLKSDFERNMHNEIQTL